MPIFTRLRRAFRSHQENAHRRTIDGYEKTSQGGRLEVKGWPEGESNPRHADFQSAALPTELSGRLCHADLQLDYYIKSQVGVKREF